MKSNAKFISGGPGRKALDQIHSSTYIGKPLYRAELKLKDFLVHWQTMMAWRKASKIGSGP